MTASSVGLLAGADSRAVFILFVAKDALERFWSGRGWRVGVDASLKMLKVESHEAVDTQPVQQPGAGDVLSNAGLMTDLRLDGARINVLNL